MATRVIFAMSRDGLFPGRLIDVNEGGTPTGSLFTSTGVAILFIVGGAFEDSRRIFENIIAVLAFFFVAAYAISFISLFVLRRREPDRERPYRAWGYPFTTGLALVGSIAFLVGAVMGDRRNSLYALLLLALSYPTFLLLRRLSSSS
jgi:APA family basic amino acid/polyamine antiporter